MTALAWFATIPAQLAVAVTSKTVRKCFFIASSLTPK